MASIIEEEIPAGAYELIRARIVEILTVELPNQAILSGDANLDAKVFEERFIAFANTDTPCINVSLANADYGDQTQLSQPGTYLFNIDAYEKSKATGNTRGDFLASAKLQKLSNVCRGILSHHKYKTLAFAKPFIASRHIRDINIGVPQNEKELENMTMSRMVFEVRASDLVPGILPPSILGFVTRAVMDETADGYLYGGNAPDPPVEPICADVTMDFNGSSISNTLSGGNKTIIVQDNAVVPIQVGTILVDNPTELRIEVDEATTLDRIYIRPTPTGATSIYNVFDDGWKVINNADTYVPPLNGMPMRVDPTNATKLIGKDNIFNHFFRYTGLDGGYYDESDSQFKDEFAVITTEALAFPSDYLIDHFTGLGHIRSFLDISAWIDGFATIDALSQAGFSDYFRHNINELASIVDYSKTQPKARIPFVDWSNFRNASSTTLESNSSNVHIIDGGGGTLNESKLTELFPAASQSLSDHPLPSKAHCGQPSPLRCLFAF